MPRALGVIGLESFPRTEGGLAAQLGAGCPHVALPWGSRQEWGGQVTEEPGHLKTPWRCPGSGQGLHPPGGPSCK